MKTLMQRLLLVMLPIGVISCGDVGSTNNIGGSSEDSSNTLAQQAATTKSSRLQATSSSVNAKPFLTQVAYGDNTFVTVGSDGRILTSSNYAKDWSEANSSSIDTHLLGVTYGDGKFVAVGLGGAIWYSSDKGKNWTNEPSSYDSNLRGVAYGKVGQDDIYIAVADDGTILRHVGNDFKNQWEKVTDSNLSDNPLFTVMFSKSLNEFVAAGANGVVATSIDGRSWNHSICENRTEETLYAISEGQLSGDVGDTITLVGSHGAKLDIKGLNDTTPGCYNSSAKDGNDYKITLNGNPFDIDITGLTYANNKILVTTESGILASTDGKDFHSGYIESGINLVYSYKGVIVAPGAEGKIVARNNYNFFPVNNPNGGHNITGMTALSNGKFIFVAGGDMSSSFTQCTLTNTGASCTNTSSAFGNDAIAGRSISAYGADKNNLSIAGMAMPWGTNSMIDNYTLQGTQWSRDGGVRGNYNLFAIDTLEKNGQPYKLAAGYESVRGEYTGRHCVGTISGAACQDTYKYYTHPKLFGVGGAGLNAGAAQVYGSDSIANDGNSFVVVGRNDTNSEIYVVTPQSGSWGTPSNKGQVDAGLNAIAVNPSRGPSVYVAAGDNGKFISQNIDEEIPVDTNTVKEFANSSNIYGGTFDSSYHRFVFVGANGVVQVSPNDNGTNVTTTLVGDPNQWEIASVVGGGTLKTIRCSVDGCMAGGDNGLIAVSHPMPEYTVVN